MLRICSPLTPTINISYTSNSITRKLRPDQRARDAIANESSQPSLPVTKNSGHFTQDSRSQHHNLRGCAGGSWSHAGATCRQRSAQLSMVQGNLVFGPARPSAIQNALVAWYPTLIRASTTQKKPFKGLCIYCYMRLVQLLSSSTSSPPCTALPPRAFTSTLHSTRGDSMAEPSTTSATALLHLKKAQ